MILWNLCLNGNIFIYNNNVCKVTFFLSDWYHTKWEMKNHYWTTQTFEYKVYSFICTQSNLFSLNPCFYNYAITNQCINVSNFIITFTTMYGVKCNLLSWQQLTFFAFGKFFFKYSLMLVLSSVANFKGKRKFDKVVQNQYSIAK